MSKRKRIINGQETTNGTNNGLHLASVAPRTKNQELVFKHYDSGKNLLLYGTCGTGKSFISLYMALKDLFVSKYYRQVVILRSAVPGRDLGFLPGTEKEKLEVFEEPYVAICSELFDRADAYKTLKNRELIDFRSTSFLRGITLNDCIVIVEECQNMIQSELHAIITRLGDNSRVIFSGDIKQNDFQYTKEKSGFPDFVKIMKQMNSFELVEFGQPDIVRSPVVKEYILVRESLEDKGEINRL